MSIERHAAPVTLNVLFDSVEADIIDALADGEWRDAQVIADSCECGSGLVNNTMHKLERYGIVRHAESGGRVEFRLTEDALGYTLGELARGELR